jgi:hypothetical protein
MGARLALVLVLAAPVAATRAPREELPDAARSRDAKRAAALLRAGSDVDARDRELGTALDVAEKQGQAGMAALLRAHGARGSGKSVGDLVCVTPWDGSGFCGEVRARSGNRLEIGLLWLEGCALGCAADAECSDGRTLGGPARGALRTGDAVVVPSWCLTRTAVSPRR